MSRSITDARVEREGRTRIDRVGRWLGSIETELWGVVVGVTLLDLALTTYGLHIGLSEANPIARRAIQSYGILALAGLKALALCVGLSGATLVPERYRGYVPAGLAVPWVPAVLANAVTLAMAGPTG